jgi:uncharacterized protein (TIGR03084 family)
MPAELDPICTDLAAEEEELDGVLGTLEENEWDLDTPADGWTIRDQVGHMAFSEDMATLAIVDPETFQADLGRGIEYIEPHESAARAKGRNMAVPELLDWWRRSRSGTIKAVRALEPDTRIPWEGPSMKPRTFLTARLMETFAHGQDVRDALAIPAPNTARLRHVAVLGVITRRYSYLVRGLEPPDAEPRVDLTIPGGEILSRGPADADDAVSGQVLDFCLVVTQRRHFRDTRLTVRGAGAWEWLRIAQAFAGRPTLGPPPGRFPR